MRKVRKSTTISWEINRKKKKELKIRKNVENGWMIWLNKSVATINTTL